MDVRKTDATALNQPHWAKTYHKDNGGTYGGLFCIFNEGGNIRRGSCYFKTVQGQVVDEFQLRSEVVPQELEVNVTGGFLFAVLLYGFCMRAHQ